jgi:hypothetical protein
MTPNTRDHKNMAILKLFLLQKITEEHAFSQMIIKQRSIKKKHKYIKQLISFMKQEGII